MDLLERIYELKLDLKVAFELIKEDKLIKTKTTNLTDEEYEQVRLLIDFLKPFRIATKYFEETTSNTNIRLIKILIDMFFKYFRYDSSNPKSFKSY